MICGNFAIISVINVDYLRRHLLYCTSISKELPSCERKEKSNFIIVHLKILLILIFKKQKYYE